MTTRQDREIQRYVNRQVERIIDEGSGKSRDVIVRVTSPADEKVELIALASGALQQRNMALSARDLLPRRASEKATRQNGKSLATEARRLKVRGSTVKTLQADADAYLKPLVQWRGSEGSRERLWASKAMAMSVAVDALKELPKEVPEVRDVYPNRLLRVPRVVPARALPQSVEEVRASAWGVHRIGALAAWGAYGARGKGTKVGILDTGVDATHPDLKGKIKAWAEFDEEGRKVTGSEPHDSDEHGTHCAGTICGGRESGRWIGVAPEATLAAAMVLGPDGGTDAQILAGIDWLIEREVDVISMSLGGLTLTPEIPNTYTEAILTALRAGIPVVTAIGNEGHQTTGSPGNDAFAFAVGATDYLDRAAGFSGGRTHIIRESNFIQDEYLPWAYMKPDVSAPGVAVQSSIPGKKWAAFNGTSMATPHVAGAIALLLSATRIREHVPPGERAFLIQDLLTGSSEELGESGQNQRFGFGRIDVLRAIDFAFERGYG